MLDLFPGHCIDTNAIIDLHRRLYPRDVFPSLWENLENLVSKGDLISPKEVMKELEQRDDAILIWAKANRAMFQGLDNEQLEQVKRILKDFPKLIDPYKTTPAADPFVVSLASSKGWTVITSEKFGSPGGLPKIPDVCKKFGVKCVPLLDFFREKEWKF